MKPGAKHEAKVKRSGVCCSDLTNKIKDARTNQEKSGNCHEDAQITCHGLSGQAPAASFRKDYGEVGAAMTLCLDRDPRGGSGGG